MQQLEKTTINTPQLSRNEVFEPKFVLSFIKQHYVLILMSLNLLLALFLRLYNLAENPVALNQDEAVDGVDAFAIAHTLRDHHGNFLPPMLEAFEDWTSPTLTYLTVPFVWLFGLSEFTVRLPVALTGVASVPLMFIFMKKLTGRNNLALLSSFFLCIMPWHVIATRWAVPTNIEVFFLLLTLCGYCWATDSKPRLWKFIFIGVCAAATAYCYPTQKMFIPLLLALFFLVDIGRKLSWKPLIVKYLTIGAAYLALTAPIYLLTLLDPAKYNARFNTISIFSLHENLLLEFLKRYFSYLGPQYNFSPWGFASTDHIQGIENTYYFLAVFFYIGLFWCIYALITRKPFIIDRTASWILLGWTFISPLPASFTVNYNHVLREMHGLPTVIIFSVIGLVMMVNLFSQKIKPAYLYGIVGAISICYLIIFCLAYFINYPVDSDDVFQYGVKEYSVFLRENEANFDSVTVDRRVNMPYIYYLFYSGKDPAQYNYQEINTGLTDSENYLIVPKIGKYHFENMDTTGLTNAKLIYNVKNPSGEIWYSIYARDRNWYVVRQY